MFFYLFISGDKNITKIINKTPINNDLDIIWTNLGRTL